MCLLGNDSTQMNIIYRALFLVSLVAAAGIIYCQRVGTLPLETSRFYGIDCSNRTMEAVAEPSRRNLFFMKTHKTGSSTLQNIFVRYAWNNELIVGLPKSDILFTSYYSGRTFSAREIQRPPSNTAINMILHHMVFDHKEVSSLLPADAIYVTLLRDPATLFQSAFNYFRNDVGPFKKAFKDGLDAFLNKPSRYFKDHESGQFWWLAKNGMFYDLGYNNLNETNEYLNASINAIDETFNLVIILEYFDMGLILLKSMMRWEIKDVAYVSINARKKRNKVPANSSITERIYEWNKADTALYKFFNRTFWDRVEAYGEDRMKKELDELDFWKNEYKRNCFEEATTSNNEITDKKLKMFNPAGIEIMQYQLRSDTKNNETCIGLIRPEVQWWKKLSLRQMDHEKVKLKRP